MKYQERLNVYFYALYDAADRQAYSGLATDVCKANVIANIMGNFRAPAYVTVRKVPELMGVENDGMVAIVEHPHRREADA